MEGTLWKWTNYFSGWQPRWFVLENGILSYYKSQDDVVNGCKGSIKMSVCDVNVHSTDTARLDLIIPGEAHFYVRAATPQEKQQWLVALGSAKACLTNGRVTSSPPNLTVEIPEEQLKSKKSELRLYCDLLMQQVHSVKSAVQSTAPPSASELTEATSLLTATCDTFIRTLEDCMKLSSAQAHLDPSPSPDVPSSVSPNKKSSKSVPWAVGPVQRAHSVDSSSQNGHLSDDDPVQGYIPSRGHKGQRSKVGSPGPVDLSPSSEVKEFHTPTIDEIRQSLKKLTKDEIVPTFISTMPLSFHDVTLGPNKEIPTTAFLDACKPVLPIFDKVNPTAFAPVKLDISGNINKIQQKFSTDPDNFDTLQKMVEFEVQNKQNMNPNSATVALLWLKRALEFTECFLQEYLAGVDDLTLAANTAYGKTLKEYHGWVMRGVFALTMKAVPSNSEFLQHLALEPSHTERPTFKLSVLRDLDNFVTDLGRPLKVLRDFYTSRDLDSDEQV